MASDPASPGFRAASSAALRLAITVPMHNEELNAEPCVGRIHTELPHIGCPATIIVVDDGSRDGTPEILRRLAAQYSDLRVVTHAANRGYGAALRTAAVAAAECGCTHLLFMDADLTNDPKYIADFVERVRGGADVVVASRYTAGGAAVGVPLYRRVISRLGNWLCGLLFGLQLSDSTNGFRLLPTDLLTGMPARENGFAILMEQLYFARQHSPRFAEVPYTLTARAADQGQSHFRYTPKTFIDYLKYPCRAFVERVLSRGGRR